MSQIISFDIGIKNLAYCIMQYVCDQWRVVRLEKVDLNCPKNNHQKIIDATIELLDVVLYEQADKSRKTYVLIECQMTSIMRCIQTVINTYFKIHGTLMMANMEIETHYISPKHKLNLITKYEGQYKSMNSHIEHKNKYKKNKSDAVDLGEWLLINKYNFGIDEILLKLQGSKKIDDEMDCFLMNIYFIEKILLSNT